MTSRRDDPGSADDPTSSPTDEAPRGDGDPDDLAAGLGNGAPDDEVPPVRRPGRSSGGQVLGAAMLGLGQVIEPDKARVDIEVEAPTDPLDDDPLAGVDFGDLPEL